MSRSNGLTYNTLVERSKFRTTYGHQWCGEHPVLKAVMAKEPLLELQSEADEQATEQTT